MENIPESAILHLDGNRGQYMPRDFFEITIPECIKWDCSDETKTWILATCKDPENESYWHAWNDAENHCTIVDPDSGIEYYLYQDMDLWLVPKGENDERF